MGSVTPFVIAGEGYVRVEVNWQDFPHARKCWIRRRSNGSTQSVILRDGDAARLSNGIAVAFDHEMPLDVPVIYRSNIALNQNGDFIDGVSEWTNTANNGTVGAVAQDRSYYVPEESSASLRLTPTGAATSRAVSEFVPVTAGQQYTITGHLMLPDYWSGGVGVMIYWYNGTTPNGTVGAANDFAPSPGIWAQYGFAATAPASTTHARLVAIITGSAPATLPMFVGEMYLTTTGTTIVASTSVVVPSDGGGWWTDPLHPWTKLRLQVDLAAVGCNSLPGVAYLGVGDETFPSDSSLMEVNDAEYPVATWNRRKAGRSSIRVATRRLTDLAKVRELHASGAPLLLQMHRDYGETDAYGLYGDLSTPRIASDQREEWRLIGASFGKVGPPPGPAEGTLKTRYMDFGKYTTFAAATAAGVTWLDGLQGELAL